MIRCWRIRNGLQMCEGLDMPKPLDLPSIQQRDDHSCGDVCRRIVEQWQIGRNSRASRLSNPITGTDPLTLESSFRLDRKWNAIGGEMMVDDLDYYCRTWRPPIALITCDFDGEPDSHYVVVAGVYRNKVHFVDPLNGWNIIPIEDWLKRWHGRGRYADFRQWGVAAWPAV